MSAWFFLRHNFVADCALVEVEQIWVLCIVQSHLISKADIETGFVQGL